MKKESKLYCGKFRFLHAHCVSPVILRFFTWFESFVVSFHFANHQVNLCLKSLFKPLCRIFLFSTSGINIHMCVWTAESAEIWHVYSLCVKKCPCGFFFQECRNIWRKLCQIQPPPPSLPLCPSPNTVEFRSLRAKTLCMCLLRYWREIERGGLREGRGGGGVNSQECVCSLASPLVEKTKTQGHFLTQKE